MAQIIQAHENGALMMLDEFLGRMEPGTRFPVEPYGDVGILRREAVDAERWWATTTPEQRVSWLHGDHSPACQPGVAARGDS